MSTYPLLSHISSPHDVQKLSEEQLISLCGEIRLFLITSLSKTGGHLASNLGIVEIATAIDSVFASPTDKIVYDVGHQCYVHKLLTGRMNGFATLRQFGGMSGFPKPSESEADAFIAGHASMSISASLGLARARTLNKQDSFVVCVIGDGALTGGMAYEALNDAGQSGEPLIVIYNDNEMSISQNVGAISQRFSRMRLKPQYINLKSKSKRFFRKFEWGEKAIKAVSAAKGWAKALVLKQTIFELMGFTYWGPADGNDLKTVKYLISEAKKLNKPVVLHFKTLKGKGYKPSEVNPGYFHGISPFDIETGMPVEKSTNNFSAVIGCALASLAATNDKLCAITAAMKSGTGLSLFAQTFPESFFDVGIAEEHAITMCGGLAAGGMIPVFAVYSTFLQRGFDQLIHDIAIMSLPVIICVDRAGIVGADGETHQGEFDVPYLTAIPNFEIYSPSSFSEAKSALTLAVNLHKGPVAIRYPKGAEGAFTADTFLQTEAIIQMGADITIVSYGIMINEAISAAKILAENSISVEIIKLNSLVNYNPDTLINSVAKTKRIVFIEDCGDKGCIGEKIEAMLAESGNALSFARRFNLGTKFVPAGKTSELYNLCGISAECVAAEVLGGIKNGR